MAIFGWGKKGDGDKGPGDSDPGGPASNGDKSISFSPEKAEKFFSHARTVHETGNYSYAMQSWINGLRLDPSTMKGLEGFFGSASGFLRENSKPDKDLIKSVSGKTDVDKYLLSLVEWGMRPEESSLAVRATELAANLGLREPARWIGERALNAVSRQKPRKDQYVKLMEAFKKANAFDLAVRAGEVAYNMDKSDGELGGELRNMHAQATMTKGGFENPGQEGGFRANIRDAAKQKQLEDADKITKSAETVDLLLAQAEAEFAKRPEDLPTINVYTRQLIARGRPEDEQKAFTILMATFERTNQFRYRMEAGNIRLRQERRKLSALRQKAAAAANDAALQEELRAAHVSALEAELEEQKIRAEAYPTDLQIKFEVGKLNFALGHYEDAVAMLQQAKDDPRNRASAMNLMAQSFVKIGWNDEAIETFRQALDAKDALPELMLEIRYGLMTALQAKGGADRDLPSAEEADRIASSIAIQQIGYKDIRARREALKKLIADLKARPAD